MVEYFLLFFQIINIWQKVGLKKRPRKKQAPSEDVPKIAQFCRHSSSTTPQPPGNYPVPLSLFEEVCAAWGNVSKNWADIFFTQTTLYECHV